MSSNEELRKRLNAELNKRLSYDYIDGTGKTKSEISTMKSNKKSKLYQALSERLGNGYASVNGDYINSFLEDSQNYFKNAQSSSVNYDNAQNMYAQNRAKWSSLKDQADTIRAYYNANEKNLDAKSYSDMISYLDDFDKGSANVLKYYRDNADYYSQWKNKESYDYTVAQNEKKQSYERMTDAELEKAYKETKPTLLDRLSQYTRNVSAAPISSDSNLPFIDITGYNEKLQKDAEKSKANVLNRDVDAQMIKNEQTRRIGEQYNKLSATTKKLIDEYAALASENDALEMADVAAGFSGTGNTAMRNTLFVDANKRRMKEISSVLDSGGISNWQSLVNYSRTEKERKETEERNAEFISDMNELGAFGDVLGTGVSLVANAGAGIGNLGTISNALGDKYDNQYSAWYGLANLSNAIREDVLERNNAVIDIPVLGERDLFDDLYTTFTSSADSIIAGATFGNLGGAVIGAQAAVNGYIDALNNGADSTDALITSIANGINETLFETLSIGQFKKLSSKGIKTLISTEGVKTLAGNILKSMGVNASEEFNTELANMAIDYIVNGGASQYVRNYEQALSEGFTEQEARSIAQKAFAAQAAEAGYGGALQGILMGGGASAIARTVATEVDDRSRGAALKKSDTFGNINEVIKSSADVDVNTKAKARDIAEALERGEKVSNRDIGKTQRLAFEQMSDSAQKVVTDAVKQRLSELGVKKSDIEASVNVVINAIENRDISDISGNEQKVAAEFLNNEEWAKKALNSQAAKQMGLFEFATAANTAVKPQYYKVATDGKTQLKSGEKVQIKTVSVDSAAGDAKVVLTNGKTVSADDILFGTNREALAFEALNNLNLPGEQAQLVYEMARESGKSMYKWLNAANEVANLGRNNISVDEVKTQGIASELTAPEAAMVYDLARKYAGENPVRARTRAAEYVGVSFNGNQISRDNIDEVFAGYNDMQKTGAKAAYVISDAAKVNVVLYETKNINGKYEAVVNGSKTSANGWYDPNTNTIYLDVNAGNTGAGTVLFTLSHELTHFINEWSPEKFKVLADFLVNEYGKKNKSVDELVKEQVYKHNRVSENKWTIANNYDDAFEEFVADSMEVMLADPNVADKLQKLAQKDKSLVKKILDYIKDFIKQFKALDAYKNASPETEEGRFVKEMGDSLDELQNLFADALASAGKASRGAEVTANYSGNGAAKAQIREDFEKSFDDWFNSTTAEERIKDGGRLLLGTTSSVLKDIGVKDYSLYIGKSKIQNILNSHKDMTSGIIKKAAYLLDEPILILQSQTSKDSIVLFGEVFTKSNKPVMMSLLLNPRNKSGEILDFAVVTSTYSRRKNNVQNLINNSTIYYINENKNRTDKWLSALGLQLPSAITTYGSINRITEIAEKVNNKNSVRDSEGKTITEQQAEYFKNSKVRDADGNLLVVYHGTDAEFNVFDILKAGKNGRAEGFGFYFTDDTEISAKYGDNQKKVYLNITKPLYGDRVTLKKSELEKLAAAVIDYENKRDDTDWRDSFISNYIYTYGGGSKATYIREFVDSVWENAESDQDLIYEIANGAGMNYDAESAKEFYDVLYNSIGVDGNIAVWEHADGESTVYVAFRPEQIKLTSNEKPTSDVDVRYSERDSEYLELAKNPEKNEARLREMVDETAKAAMPNTKVIDDNGNPKVVYHGRTSEFNVFDRSYANIEGDFGKGYYFSSDYYDSANNYGEEGADITNKIAKEAERIEADSDGEISYEEAKERAREKYITAEANVLDCFLDIENPVMISDDNRGTFLDFNEEYDEEYDEYGEPEGLLVDFIEALQNQSREYAWNDVDFSFLYEDAYDGGLYAYDAVRAIKENILDELMDENGDLAINEVIRAAFEEIGFDGIIDSWVSYKFSGMGLNRATTHYIAFDSSQIKSADLVTYDDNGNIIPLSERFNSENEDIRYSERDTNNRTLLANALETAATSEAERKTLASYKAEVEEQNARQAELNKVNAEISQIMFTPGKRDMAKYNSLLARSRELKNEIAKRDKKLLRLESTEALKKVLEYETQRVRRETRAKEVQRTESRNKTVIRHQIMSTVKELDSYLNKGTKERNVKNGMRDMVDKALVLSDLLLEREPADRDVLAMMKESDFSSDEQRKLFKKYRATLESRAGYIERREKATVEQFAELDNMVDVANRKLREIEKSLADAIEYKKNSLNANALSDAIGALYDSYKALENSDVGYIQDAYKPFIADALNTLKTELQGQTLRRMSKAQLEQVHDAYRMVLHSIRDANKAFINGKRENVIELHDKTVSEIKETVKNKLRAMSSKDDKSPIGFTWQELKPIYAFERIGSKTLKRLFNEIVKGQYVYGRDIAEARDFVADTREKYGFDKWDFDTIHTFDVDGKKFELDLEHIMSIYAYSRRERAYDHMSIGGFTYDKAEEYGKFIKKIRVTSEAYRLNYEDVAKITSTLTEEQVKYVEVMQDYLSDVMGGKGNEVTRTLYGVDWFKEKHYFPLQSERNYLPVESQKPVAAQASLENAGMTKQLVQRANNPIVLSAFDSVWENHTNLMSMYHGLVVPINSFNKVYNFKGYLTGETSQNIRSTLDGAFGTSANNYINNFLADINGNVVNQGARSVFEGLFSKFKKTAVAASLSTAIQQPTAIIRATSVIPPKYFVGITKGKHSETWETIKKWAPVAVIKEIGGFDVGGRTAKEYLDVRRYDGAKDKVRAIVTDSNYRDSKFSALAEEADVMGWNTIWKAAERYVADTTEWVKGSDDFYKAVANKFNEAIEYTQVYDSVISRSGYMRSKNALVKVSTAFMGEPTTSINMMYNAILQAKRKTISPAKAVGTIAAVMAASFAAAAARSLIYALRDDDEDEAYVDKYIEKLTANLIDEIMVWNLLPFVSDVTEMFNGKDVGRTDLTLFDNIITEWQKVTSGKYDGKPYQAVEKLGGSFAAFFGLPLGNLLRTGREIFNIFKFAFDDAKSTAESARKAVLKGANKEKAMSDANKYLERGKTDKAKDVINGLINDKVAGGKTRKEALGSIKSSLTAYWKPKYIEADWNERNEIRKKLYSTGVYDSLDALDKIVSNWLKDKE